MNDQKSLQAVSVIMMSFLCLPIHLGANSYLQGKFMKSGFSLPKLGAALKT